MTSKPPQAPSPSNFRLLAIGDVHLGIRPSSLPDELADWGVSPSDLTPEAALSKAVDLAIREKVNAVLFAGDVVESTNARFEALRPLEVAVRRLSDAGIQVLAVVGNHDVEALPRLANRIGGLTIIGKGGAWESHTIEREGRPVAEVLGWSFPEPKVKISPVAELNRSPIARSDPGLPRLGLLHADVGALSGNYAPVSREELLAADVDLWLLGHIHKPSLAASLEKGDAIPHGYLGSLTGLDPGETGPHGPWLIRFDDKGRPRPQQCVTSALRWEHVEVRIGESSNAEDTADLILDGAERKAREIQGNDHTPAVLGVRVHLVGRTAKYDSIQKYVRSESWKGLWREVGGTVVFVNKVLNEVDLAIDLENLARGDDPPGLLARKLLSIARRDETGNHLIEKAREALRAMAENMVWSPLEEVRDPQDPLADDALAATLEQSGTEALHAMLRQRQSNGAGPGDSA